MPQTHRGAYDLVTNCGATEHVINQTHSFKMVHDLPWSGMTSHGFFNYKPILF